MLVIGNKKFRNLPEQVGFNTEQIEEIKKQLDGMVVEDHLVVLDASSGTLTDEELNTLDAPLAFVSYNEKLYIKTLETLSAIVFKSCELVADEIGSSYYALGQSAVYVTISTKSYVVATNQIIDVYSKNQIDSLLLSKVYPVGAIYMSVNSTSPASLFGGTWEQLENRFLLGAGTNYSAGATGGEAAHTLTINEMPSHHHIGLKWGNNTPMTLGIVTTGNYYGLNYADGSNTPTGISTGESGGNSPHNNMPPYLVVYMWKRTA